jgi:hypothetical protein
MKWVLLLVPALAFAQTNSFLEDGWTPDYCNRVGVAVSPDAVPTGVIEAMHSSSDIKIISEACGANVHKPGGLIAGCAINTRDNYWTIWYVNECTWQHEQCHAMYQTQEHTKYHSLERERWLLGCGKVVP